MSEWIDNCVHSGRTFCAVRSEIDQPKGGTSDGSRDLIRLKGVDCDLAVEPHGLTTVVLLCLRRNRRSSPRSPRHRRPRCAFPPRLDRRLLVGGSKFDFGFVTGETLPSLHRNDPDLLIGGLSAQDFLYPVLYQGRHPFFQCQAEYVGGPGSGLDEPLHLFRSS